MTEKVILGNTGIKVTRLGFGGIPIQRVSEKEAVETVIHAIDRGVDFIDTSRAYTTSETRIGIALRETGKDIVLATKSQQHSADKMRRDVEISLKELQRDKIELYQCHFIRDFDVYKKITSRGGALEGLLKARDEGLIEHIGITSHSLDVLDRVIDDGLFETIMVCYSFLEPKAAERVIPRALANNIGVIVMKVFSGGVIDNARLAIKYALAPEGTVVIPGVESKEIFDENWEIYHGDPTLSRKEREEIRAIQSEFGKQFCRRCDYCQPCPEGIPIQHVIGIKSMVKRMGPDILQKGFPKIAIEQARNCTECGQCLERCPYELPIPELIKKTLEWVDEQLSGK
ncbi:MAG: aldo/keto reductase [Deltaproteobacteria bacterium]|nr:aldo/keto reductase [Deltaproteobacteria bacterium]MBW2595627.1 aldo/keto reductase [Deltaproteobacteria bacterium]MBW2649568.1 aldo/keto reductase [Deltaproteobacteria bacterium]